MEEVTARRKRINRLKKLILGTILVAILIPIIISVILSIQLHFLKKDNTSLRVQLTEISEKYFSQVESVFSEETIEESEQKDQKVDLSDKEEESGQTQIEAASDQIKKVYLTFDDGPSIYTDQILDILKAYDIKATFFVVGKTDERSKAAYKRIVQEGHTLGIHSMSHKYQEIYATKESFIEDITSLQEYLYEETGIWVRYIRFPGGSSNTVSKVDMQELIDWTKEQDFTYYDWNVASGDAVNTPLSEEEIVQNCMNGIAQYQVSMVLMHDAAEKKSTVEALPELITKLRLQGEVQFLAIDDDTPLIQHK